VAPPEWCQSSTVLTWPVATPARTAASTRFMASPIAPSYPIRLPWSSPYASATTRSRAGRSTTNQPTRSLSMSWSIGTHIRRIVFLEGSMDVASHPGATMEAHLRALLGDDYRPVHLTFGTGAVHDLTVPPPQPGSLEHDPELDRPTRTRLISGSTTPTTMLTTTWASRRCGPASTPSHSSTRSHRRSPTAERHDRIGRDSGQKRAKQGAEIRLRCSLSGLGSKDCESCVGPRIRSCRCCRRCRRRI
jgi:hypothetical protein